MITRGPGSPLNMEYLLKHFMPQSFWWMPSHDMDFVLDFKDWQSIRKVWSALLEMELPDIRMRNSAATSHSSEPVGLPPEFNGYLEKIYRREQAYRQRISHGGEHASLLEAIEEARRDHGPIDKPGKALSHLRTSGGKPLWLMSATNRSAVARASARRSYCHAKQHSG